MAEDQNLNAIVRSLLGLTGSQQPMETNALIRELARRMVLSGLFFDESTGAPQGLSGAALTDLNADELTSGTVPDARFPATLPAVSGENLTDLNADELSSGTVPDARFPATLPAVSGANLTNLDADDLASGTVPDARFPATLPAISGANLTNLDASDLASGTVNEARLGSGTGSVHKVLRGNNTWGDVPGITTDGASAVQRIAFAASQSASAGANTLDDYEEGSWTPTDGSGAGLTFTSTEGSYIKIGQLVIACCTLTYPATADGSNAAVSGLPFTSQSTTNNVWGGSINITTESTLSSIQVGANSTSVTLLTSAGVNITNATMTGDLVRITAIYRSAS